MDKPQRTQTRYACRREPKTMSDETVNDNSENQPAESTERVGFCQDCGRPLTRETVRTVGSGVFCEPCLEVRAASGSYGAVPPPPGAAGPVYTEPFPPVGGNFPSPVLAGFLGLIPGVGAMYNGQFAKGIAHIVIFALLQSLARMSDIFGFLVAGWIFYQVFEAYHTAKARREGRPLPDPLGLNNIGVQVSTHFRGTGAGAPPNPGFYPGYAAPGPAAAPPTPGAWGSVPVPPPVSPYAQSSPYTPPPPPPAPVWDTPAWTPPPPAPAGQEWVNTSGAYSDAPVYPVVPVRRNTVPAAAAWLIGLGVVFMVFNFVPDLRFSIHKIFPFLLMAFAIWLFTRRMIATGGLSPMEDEGDGYATRAVCFLRWPVILFTVSVLWMLQEFDVVRFGRTWPVVVIVIGLLLLLERSIGTRAVPVAGAVPPADPSAVNGDGKGI